MNKKNIVLILIITIFLSVMVMSVLGKESDDENRIDATGLVIYDQEGNEVTTVVQDSPNNDKAITIKADPENTDDIVYNFSIELLPADTTDASLQYTVFAEGVPPTMEEIFPNQERTADEEEEPVKEVQRFHYYKMTFAYDQRAQMSIRFKFNFGEGGTANYEYLRFLFDEHPEEDVDDNF